MRAEVSYPRVDQKGCAKVRTNSYSVPLKAGSLVEALDLGCADIAAVRHLLMADPLRHSVGEALDIGSLSAYERPLPTMIEDDQLFSVSMQVVQA